MPVLQERGYSCYWGKFRKRLTKNETTTCSFPKEISKFQGTQVQVPDLLLLQWILAMLSDSSEVIFPHPPVKEMNNAELRCSHIILKEGLA